MESSRRDLLNDTAEHMPILKNSRNPYHSVLVSHPKTDTAFPKTEVLFLMCSKDHPAVHVPQYRQAVLPDSATPSNLNASNFLTVKDNMMLNPIFGMLSSRAIQNIPYLLGYL